MLLDAILASVIHLASLLMTGPSGKPISIIVVAIQFSLDRSHLLSGRFPCKIYSYSLILFIELDFLGELFQGKNEIAILL